MVSWLWAPCASAGFAFRATDSVGFAFRARHLDRIRVSCDGFGRIRVSCVSLGRIRVSCALTTRTKANHDRKPRTKRKLARKAPHQTQSHPIAPAPNAIPSDCPRTKANPSRPSIEKPQFLQVGAARIGNGTRDDRHEHQQHRLDRPAAGRRHSPDVRATHWAPKSLPSTSHASLPCRARRCASSPHQ